MEHGEVITFDDVSIHPVATKIQATFLTRLMDRKETTQGFYHEANGDFETQSSKAVRRRKLRIDQQLFIYSTTLTYLT